MAAQDAIGIASTAIEMPFPDAPAAVPQWAMIARTGAWLGHPAREEIITPRHLRSALDYFNAHYAAHGADLVVDYHHASALAPRQGGRAPAAGWITAMQLRADGTELWGRILWTTEAAAAVARRQYRFLSPLLRFNAPDRVTGEPVPMTLHSVALTNTPFLTELESLNAADGRDRSPATDGGAQAVVPEGGESMSLLDSLAEALGKEPKQVASEFGLASVEDECVARALAGLVQGAARAHGLEAQPAGQAAPAAPVSVAIANELGVPPDADETEVKAALIRLRAPSACLDALRARLGLEPDAPELGILNAVEALQQSQRDAEAGALVDEAVAAGKVPPAHRDFYLREALNDLEATRHVLNAMPVLMQPQRAPQPAPRKAGGRRLDEAEESVCRQLGLSAEAFVAAAD